MTPIDDVQESIDWMLLAKMVVWWLEEKEKNKTVKGERDELAKEPPTFKSIFSLEHKDSE